MKTIDDVCKLHTLSEAKLVLLVMKLKGIKEGKLEDISDATGLSVPEVSQGAHMLKILGINKSRNFDNVVLEDEWLAKK